MKYKIMKRKLLITSLSHKRDYSSNEKIKVKISLLQGQMAHVFSPFISHCVGKKIDYFLLCSASNKRLSQNSKQK
jgi:hypothetical protein